MLEISNSNTTKKPLSFLRWILITIIVFILSISLGSVALSKKIESDLEHNTVVLNNYSGAYHLKGLINHIETEFILDTGASESVISKNDLTKIQEVSTANIIHLEKGLYTMADGSIVLCDRIEIDSLKIGQDYIDNIVFGVMTKDTDNLLGKNVLDKFRRWSVNKRLNELTLIK